jgi:hypothetical protein
MSVLIDVQLGAEKAYFYESSLNFRTILYGVALLVNVRSDTTESSRVEYFVSSKIHSIAWFVLGARLHCLL